jgi:hypothetical protein
MGTGDMVRVGAKMGERGEDGAVVQTFMSMCLTLVDVRVQEFWCQEQRVGGEFHH